MKKHKKKPTIDTNCCVFGLKQNTSQNQKITLSQLGSYPVNHTGGYLQDHAAHGTCIQHACMTADIKNGKSKNSAAQWCFINNAYVKIVLRVSLCPQKCGIS